MFQLFAILPPILFVSFLLFFFVAKIIKNRKQFLLTKEEKKRKIPFLLRTCCRCHTKFRPGFGYTELLLVTYLSSFDTINLVNIWAFCNVGDDNDAPNQFIESKGSFRPAVVDGIKLCGGNLDFSKKIKKFWKFVLMSDHAQKCENNAVFKQSYTLKLFIAFKMVYSYCFSSGWNIDFPEKNVFFQKKLLTSTTGLDFCLDPRWHSRDSKFSISAETQLSTAENAAVCI